MRESDNQTDSLVTALFKFKELPEILGSGNYALLYSKFFNQWYQSFLENPLSNSNQNSKTKNKQSTELKKPEWIKLFVNSGDKSADKNAQQRIAKLVSTQQGSVRRYKQISPMVTGIGLPHPIENGFLWHHTMGIPYLPGSSIKGMVHAWATEWGGTEDKEEIRFLFGSGTEDNSKQSEAGKKDESDKQDICTGNIIFFDAFPVENCQLMAEIITPHVGKWNLEGEEPPSDWNSPVPIPFLAIKPGAIFQFALAPRNCSLEPAENAKYVKKAFEYLEMALKTIGMGAKTSIGFGRYASHAIGIGSRVRILETHSDKRFHHMTGRIEKATPSYYTIRLDPVGEGKARSTTAPSDQIEPVEE